MDKQKQSIYGPGPKSHVGLVAFGALAVLGSVTAAYIWIGGRSASSEEGSPAAVASQTTASPATTAASLPPLPTGPMRVGNVEVVKPTLELGKQPLNVTIQPAFELKNVGTDQALLGEASIEVLEGCCPQKPIMGSLSIQPGSTTTIAVPMMMHKGMDGPHLFHVTVPVLAGSGGGEALHLYVRGNFG